MAKEVETVRLRNVNSGAIVSVAAEKVARMGNEWQPAPGAAAAAVAAAVAAAKKTGSKSSND